ncbi:hypothetical protein LEMLEM_LOCUS18234, partial [Lemmus lemmus]
MKSPEKLQRSRSWRRIRRPRSSSATQQMGGKPEEMHETLRPVFKTKARERAGKMRQKVRALLAKPYNPGSIPGTYLVGENSLSTLSSDLCMGTMSC